MKSWFKISCFVLMTIWIGVGGRPIEAETTISLMTPLSRTVELEKRETPTHWNGRERKIVYLTFDDGPSRNTQAIIDILEDYGIQGTFFFVGNQIEGRESIIEMVDERGHYVGTHSYSHDVNKIYDLEQPRGLVEESLKVQDMVYQIIGKQPLLLRPPYGSQPHLKSPIADELVKEGFKIWDWTVDTYDWKAKTVQHIMTNVEKTAGNPRDIVLMHEKDITVEALPQIIEYYQALGYEFKAYDETQHFVHNYIKDERL